MIAITQVTLDGVMQAPGGPKEDPSNGFAHGGWAMPFVDDALNQIIDEIISGEFDMLLGRRTYDIFASYWPNQGDNPIATELIDEHRLWVFPVVLGDGKRLFDEHRLWVFPVVLGDGKRLFGNGVPPHGLTLVGTQSTPSGVLVNTYRDRTQMEELLKQEKRVKYQ